VPSDYSEYVQKLIRLLEEEVERAGSGDADALETSLALQHSLSLVYELVSSISRHSSAPELLASAPREALGEALEKVVEAAKLLAEAEEVVRAAAAKAAYAAYVLGRLSPTEEPQRPGTHI